MRKTKILALLLAVAMIASMIVPSVSAADPATCPVHTETTSWTEVAEGTWTGGAIADGHYKLTGNQTLASALTVAGNVCIDLAGYNITASASKATPFRAFEVTGVLTITDSAEVDGAISGGNMEGTSDAGSVHIYGGNILVTGEAAKLNLYGGTITGGYMKAGNVDYHVYGGNVALLEGAELNIYGGAITDGKIEAPQQSAYYQGGGNIYALNSTVNVYGGTVSGGDVTNRYTSSNKNDRKVYGAGGNISVTSGTFYMEGGLIDNGNLDVLCKSTNTANNPKAITYALGGNVYCASSTVTIKGGVISNGTLAGEVTASGTGEKTLEAHGANLYIKGGTAEIKGNAQILDGEVLTDATSARGGNLYVASGANVTISENAVISGGTCPTKNARGGNIFVVGTLNINGGTISNGAAGWGSNVMLQSGATINMNGGSITGGTADPSVVVQRGTFNMIAGTIENAGDYAALSVQGTTDSNGGKLYISGGVVGDIAANRASLVEVTAGTVGAAKLTHTATMDIKAGVIVTGMWEVAETATLNTVEGIICRFNPALNGVEGYEAYVMSKSTGTTYYTIYEKLADALAAAQNGNTVTLIPEEVTADAVVVPAGVTLNLYGHILTADSVTATATGAQIKDEKYSKNAGGKLICANVAVSDENNFAPIYFEGAYHFQKYTVAENLQGNVYKFYLADAAEDLLLDDVWAAGYANSGLKLEISATYKLNGVEKEAAFVIGSELVETYVAGWDTKMFVLTITSDLTNVTDLDFTVRVVAD